MCWRRVGRDVTERRRRPSPRNVVVETAGSLRRVSGGGRDHVLGPKIRLPAGSTGSQGNGSVPLGDPRREPGDLNAEDMNDSPAPRFSSGWPRTPSSASAITVAVGGLLSGRMAWTGLFTRHLTRSPLPKRPPLSSGSPPECPQRPLPTPPPNVACWCPLDCSTLGRAGHRDRGRFRPRQPRPTSVLGRRPICCRLQRAASTSKKEG